jgi:hypothetical protein
LGAENVPKSPGLVARAFDINYEECHFSGYPLSPTQSILHLRLAIITMMFNLYSCLAAILLPSLVAAQLS